MITTTGLARGHRSRGRDVTALDGVDLRVREGEVFGAVGRGGAGGTVAVPGDTTDEGRAEAPGRPRADRAGGRRR